MLPVLRRAVTPLTLALVTLITLAGCKTAPKAAPGKWSNTRPVSQAGSSLYYKGRAAYELILASGMQGESRVEALNRNVFAPIDGAIQNDPRNPLFLSKRGDLLAEMGADHYDPAQASYRQALAITRDWVPAWLGLADLAVRRGDLRAAMEHLRNAELAVDSVQRGVQPDQPNQGEQMVRILVKAVSGLNLPPREKPTKAINDPSLAEQDQLRMLVHWMQENEQWRFENPLLLVQLPGAGNQAMIDTAGLYRRLRARIEFGRLRVGVANGELAESLMSEFDRVFSWDPDLFEARLAKALLLREMKNYRAAERMLRPYMDSKNLKIRNHAGLLYEMAGIYADWFAAEPSPELATAADAFFDRLHHVNNQHAAGWITRARFYLTSGKALDRPDIARQAAACINNAEAVLQGPTETTAALRREVEAL